MKTAMKQQFALMHKKSERDKHHMISLTCATKKINERTHKQTHRYKLAVVRGEGVGRWAK